MHKSNSKDSLQFRDDFSPNFTLNCNNGVYQANQRPFKKKKRETYAESDMSNYLEELQFYRSANSLTHMRSRVSLKLHSKSVSDSRTVIHPLEVEQFMEIMNSHDTVKIIQLLDNIAKACEITPSVISEISTSEEVIESLVNTLESSESEDLTKSLLLSISALFPFCGNKMIYLVDLLYLEFSHLLESATSTTILPALNLIISISNNSYGRNSLTSVGICELLIHIATSVNTPLVAIQCCIALESIFSDGADDADIILLMPLLSLPYIEAKAAIISTLISITSKTPIATNKLCQSSQIHLKLISMLSDENLRGQSLRLITNICGFSDISYVKEMIDNGLVMILINFINSDKAAISLHAISLLLERLPEEVFALLPPNFTDNLIELAYGSPFEIMKQASYLIATEIYYLNLSEIIKFIKPETIELLVEMLSSGQDDVMLQCLHALGKIAQVCVNIGKEKEYSEYLNSTDVISVLESLGENRLQIVSDRARSLMKKLEPILYTDS